MDGFSATLSIEKGRAISFYPKPLLCFVPFWNKPSLDYGPPEAQENISVEAVKYHAACTALALRMQMKIRC